MPYSPDWSQASSFPVNQEFLNAVVEAVQALLVVEIYTFSLIQCTDEDILKGHSADKYSEDEIRKTAKTYFKMKVWRIIQHPSPNTHHPSCTLHSFPPC